MANRNLPTYYLVEADMLPEIFLKVMEAKELLQTGECSTVGDAVNRVGISRSAFYKYKDSITAFQDLRHGHILTFQVMLRDQTGLLSAVLSVLFHFTAVRWSAWLLQEYHGEAFWQSAWPLPAIYAAFLIFCIPLDPSVVLLNRIMIIAVLAVSISLLGIFLLLYEMYRVAQEYTRNTQLDRENQLLGVESRRYMELREYMEQTRSLRHDFRQHLHVISGLTEAGQLDELKHYLSQYESELSEARPTLCANPAVDALAGHYDHEARQKGVPIEWKLELPVLLPMPEADLCMILGNLLENALDASRKLTPDQRQIRVMARMLSPAMLGIVVENRYDGVLKKQSGILHSTKHEGIGIGLVSIETAVRKYTGDLTVETKNNVFRANVLLNL